MCLFLSFNRAENNSLNERMAVTGVSTVVNAIIIEVTIKRGNSAEKAAGITSCASHPD